MYRYYIEDDNYVPPFNQPASELTIGTQPLKLYQEEIFSQYLGRAVELRGVFHDKNQLPEVQGEAVIYRDNLWFDREFLDYFMFHARRSKRACRVAFAANDPAFRAYTVPLAHDIEASTDAHGNTIYLLDFWYFPNGYTADIMPIVVPSDAREIGFYSVPDYMAGAQGDLTHYAAMRAIVSIESWVHVYFASIIFSTFARAGRVDYQIETSFFKSLKLLWHALIDQKQILSASGAVEIGENCSIDPTAIIRGPAKIGNNVSIGAGAIIDNCTIGNDVTIDAGCMLFQSVVGNGSFLPFRAALYLTAIMENVIVSQNTCLQMCVIGRNSFVGAGNTFTDFMMVGNEPVVTINRHGDLESVGQIVLGGAVGHNCRIGSGMVVMPGRVIESDVVLIASSNRRVLLRNVSYEESDHHVMRAGTSHHRLYPRLDEQLADETIEEW